ncbi:MAG: helix-turn-helix domain-containing protein [Thermoanaerobaculia bacterium]
MARRKEARKSSPKRKLYTLTEVSKKTGISMPTLQRYKKQYQSRLPTVGKGRRQRYPKSALAVFGKIKKENLKRRGRPRKQASVATPAKRRAARKRGPRTPEGLLTLSEIGRRTGISYPTLVRYVKLFRDRIPHQGKGRKRRFSKEAVKVFRQLRSQSKRGRRKKARVAAVRGARYVATTDARLAEKIQALEKAQAEISRQLEAVIETLRKPLRLTITTE